MWQRRQADIATLKYFQVPSKFQNNFKVKSRSK